jgi:hypothetical protein
MKKPFFQRIYDFFFGPPTPPPEWEGAEHVDLAPYRVAPNIPTREEIHEAIKAKLAKAPPAPVLTADVPVRVRNKPKAKPAAKPVAAKAKNAPAKPKKPAVKKLVAKRPARKR